MKHIQTQQFSFTKTSIKVSLKILVYVYLFIYLFNRFHLDTMLKKTREKNTFEQDTKNEGRRCGTHNIARLQIKCALTENKQILTI